MSKRKVFLNREIRISIVFGIVIFAAKFLPAFFSFNQMGDLYTRYYTGLYKFNFLDFVILAFLLRLIVVSVIFAVKNRKRKSSY